jgi:hypothetical protein
MHEHKLIASTASSRSNDTCLNLIISNSREITKKTASIQVVNHLPIAKKTYKEKAASKFQISPLDGAQYEKILTNNIQRSNKEERYTKENTTRLRPRKNTSTQIHTNSVKNAKIQHQFKQTAKTGNFAQHELQQEKPNDRKQLYEAIHLYMMKLALVNETIQKTTTSRYHSSLVKTTPHIKTRRKVPKFAARWCSIRKHLIQSKASNQRKTMQDTTAK